MATFDQLSAEQRAIIELVLKQGQTYDELGDMLGMPTTRVMELAQTSLVTLSPVSAAEVDGHWRGQVADYLLGQQSASESTATRGHLRRSEAARAWARSLLDSLDQLYLPANMPTIPAGDSGEASEPPRARGGWRESAGVQPGEKQGTVAREPADEEDLPGPQSPSGEGGPPHAELSPEVRRRRATVAGAGALALVVLGAIFLWPIGVLSSGDEDEDASARDNERPAPRVIGQLVLKPVEGAEGAGVAAIAQRGKERQLIVQARLTPNKNREAYEVWLYNSDGNAKSLGAQVTDRQGTYQGAATLPADFSRYTYIDVSRERVDENHDHSGKSLLRGRVGDFAAPAPSGQGAAQGTPAQP